MMTLASQLGRQHLDAVLSLPDDGDSWVIDAVKHTHTVVEVSQTVRSGLVVVHLPPQAPVIIDWPDTEVVVHLREYPNPGRIVTA